MDYSIFHMQKIYLTLIVMTGQFPWAWLKNAWQFFNFKRQRADYFHLHGLDITQ